MGRPLRISSHPLETILTTSYDSYNTCGATPPQTRWCAKCLVISCQAVTLMNVLRRTMPENSTWDGSSVAKNWWSCKREALVAEEAVTVEEDMVAVATVMIDVVHQTMAAAAADTVTIEGEDIVSVMIEGVGMVIVVGMDTIGAAGRGTD